MIQEYRKLQDQILEAEAVERKKKELLGTARNKIVPVIFRLIGIFRSTTNFFLVWPEIEIFLQFQKWAQSYVRDYAIRNSYKLQQNFCSWII